MENINVLAEKIYKEGIGKAEKEAEQIIENAKKEAEKVLENADKEASARLEKAKKEVQNQRKIIESEIRLATHNALDELKNRIQHLIVFSALEKPAKELFSNASFIKDLILKLAEGWNTRDGFQIRFSKDWEKNLDDKLQNELHAKLKGTEISFDSKLGQGSFRIAEKGKNFELSFSEEDFTQFFKSYLNERTQRFLFSEE